MTQSAFTYTYSFKDIQSESGVVWVADYERHRRYPVQVSVDDSKLFSADYSTVSAPIADLIDLGVAVHTADRLSVRRNDRPYHIHLIVPVRCPEALSSASVQELLTDVLYEYTHDHWTFTFVKRTDGGRPVEFKKPLQFPVEPQPVTEVALWSGGLDSLAGLCNRLTSSPATQYILFGTGSNPHVHRVQLDVANAVKQQFSMAKLINLVQVPIHLSEISGRPVNRDLRARGFVFLLLGAACAYLQGQNSLFMYENGVGAINLPFRASEVGLDHARSVHPLSLLKMGKLVSTLLSTSFQFRNPFLFWTKAQMCKVFKDTFSTSLIASTITCDRLHRQIPMQCGCCSSCLLRRQALAVHAINDTTGYVIEGRIPRPADTLHLQAMLDQVIIHC